MIRSGSYANLAAGAPEAEVVDRISDGLREALPVAIAGVGANLTCVYDAPEDVGEALLDEVRQFMRLTAGNWPPERIASFQEQVWVEMADWPVALVMPAIAKARQRIYQPARFVSWIVEQIEGPTLLLRAEQQQLLRLQELADRPKD